MGTFDDLIPESKSSGAFDDLVPGGKPPKTESFLQRALGQASQISKPIQQGDNPLMAGAKTAFTAMASPFSNNIGREAQDMRRQGVEGSTDNPVAQFGLDVATDPTTYIGGGVLGKKAVGASKKSVGGAYQSVRDVLNPVKASGEISGAIESAGKSFKGTYGKGLSKIASKYKYVTTSFDDILNSPKTTAEKKVFDQVIEEAKFQGIDPKSLGPVESKKLLDIVKDKVGSSIVKGDVGPTEISTEKALSSLKSRQLEAFPEFADIDSSYKSIGNYNDLSGKASDILEGGGNRIKKSMQMQKLRNLDKDAFKKARNYRRANIVVKTASNPLVRAGAAIPVVGGLLKAMFRD